MSEELMADIHRSLGRIEQKVDTALAWQQTHVADDQRAFAALSIDIQSLKLARAAQSGRTRVFTALWAASASVLGSLVTTLWQHRGH